MTSFCAPNIDITDHYTCFTFAELKEIATAFNIYIQTHKVCNGRACAKSKRILITHKTKRQLWYSIYKRLNKICKHEFCWVALDFIKLISDPYLREKLKYFTFKPQMTKQRYSWISTTDINKVLQQYQDFDKTFKFIGALPSDFYNYVHLKYHEIPWYKRVGFVFNLDTHDKPGSHWVSMLIDNTTKTIEYFDSIGKPPNKYINKFIAIIAQMLPHHKVRINNITHQLQNSECGIYAMYFIIQRLMGKTFDHIKSHVIRDKQMNKFRDYIFTPRI
jgi:hypothetical protein